MELPSHEALGNIGPLIRAEWHVPAELANTLRRQLKKVPKPVTGYMLIDTGAGATAIAEHAAQQLELNVIGMTPNFGVAGLQSLNRYYARFAMLIAGRRPPTKVITREFSVCGTKELDKYSEQLTNLGLPGYKHPINLIGLLGRDFLRSARLTYDGPAKTFKLEWRPESS